MSSQSDLHVIVLAAGQGTRMKSRLPKVLHAIGGKPMLGHVLDTARELGASACHVVHGHGAEQVKGWYESTRTRGLSVRWVLQSEQKGTAHAVLQAMPKIPDDANVLVLYGDVPLIRGETLANLISAAGKGLAILTVDAVNPQGYGRIVRDRRGAVRNITEEKDATAAQRRITEVNTGVLVAPAKKLRAWLSKVGNRNAKGEYYLTDIVALAVRGKAKVATVSTPSMAEAMGVNDRAQLAEQERAYQLRQSQKLMGEGLAIKDPARFDLRGSLRFGKDVSIDVGVVMEGEVDLGDGVMIGPYVILRNVKLGAGTRVDAHSVLDSMSAGRNCRIGPFARIRPETRLADDAHVGNFVEVKKSKVGAGSKINHLSYVGDAEVGRGVNIGAGVITCNYDGANKHLTVIGDNAFIGSDSQLVAPVEIGAGATIGAGSTITRKAPADKLTVSRVKQSTVEGWKRPQKKK